MDPLIILLIGMAVVIGGVLWLRLHAFVALIGGALVVASLATPDAIKQSVMNDTRIEKDIRKQATNRLGQDDSNLTNLVQELHKTKAKHTASQSVISRVTGAFGKACGSLGILIAMAAIIGKCLLDSGGAERIIRSALGLLGEKRAPLAFTGSGFLLGTPVFFDTVFYLMIPLGKALAMRFRENYGLYIMTIVAGATMAHSLVPPTPGPLFVADQLDVDLGLMIIMGLVVGSVACATGYVYAKFVNRHKKWHVPLRDSADSPLAKLEEIVQRDDKSLPPLGLALLPVLLPIVLIAGNTILEELVAEPPVGLATFLSVVGDRNIALIISAIIALGLLALQKRGDKQALFDSVQSALASGGVVILITAAGASFGTMLQQTNIAASIRELAEQYKITGLMVLPMVFLVTAVVRTAQGSATVSMITSVGIFAGMAATLPFHPVYLAMAIGCGSKPFPWMNDSGFWVINRMSGMTIGETIRSVSFLMTAMAIDGLIAVMLLAWLFPMTG
ncbi:MAG: GntP family permease [Verrucomicrobiota bacterium]|jgi:GntP family gluconate:H+ symporter|nr:GntP family permease [Verrucomicrobiota bacterium]